MLTDAPFMIVSSDLNELSQFCFALYCLVHPLKWFHIFAPILPLSILETVQSPAPFIVGIHSSLLSKITNSDIEAHVYIDIDSLTIKRVNLPSIPQWVTNSINNFTEFSQKSVHQLILQIICTALNIHPSGSPYLNAKKIITSVHDVELEPGSAQFQLINSRTVRCLLDASKEKHLQNNFVALLSCFTNSGIIFPATQFVDEFPLRKNQVLRSQSVQFTKTHQNFKSMSVPDINMLSKSKLEPNP